MKDIRKIPNEEVLKFTLKKMGLKTSDLQLFKELLITVKKDQFHTSDEVHVLVPITSWEFEISFDPDDAYVLLRIYSDGTSSLLTTRFTVSFYYTANGFDLSDIDVTEFVLSTTTNVGSSAHDIEKIEVAN